MHTSELTAVASPVELPPTARHALTTGPARVSVGATQLAASCSTRSRICSPVRRGRTDISSATMPLTFAAAIELPFSKS